MNLLLPYLSENNVTKCFWCKYSRALSYSHHLYICGKFARNIVLIIGTLRWFQKSRALHILGFKKTYSFFLIHFLYYYTYILFKTNMQ